MEIITSLSKPLITDWIQAFGSLIALIGVAFSIWKLVVKDEQKQEQINKLTDLVSKLDIQNEIMKEQLTISVLPFFKIKENIIQGSNGCITEIRNHGHIALNIRISPFNESQFDSKNNSVFTFKLFNQDSFIDSSTSMYVNIKRISNFDTPFKSLPYSYKISYHDRMNNSYYQIVSYKDNIIDITEPKIVKIKSENIINRNEYNYEL